MTVAPSPGTYWTRNGIEYLVIAITNLPDTDRYPKTVVYIGPNNNLWSRRFDDLNRSMTYINKEESNE